MPKPPPQSPETRNHLPASAVPKEWAALAN